MADSRRVLIRVDAGLGIGFGHFTRCLAMAKALLSEGAQVTFAMRDGAPELLTRIQDAGAELILLPAGDILESADGPVWSRSDQERDARESAGTHGRTFWDAIVVDHYRLDASWEGAAASFAQRVVVIDDLANRPHQCDVLVDHNWYGDHNDDRYRELVSPGTMLLLGPRYSMLHPEYAAARVRRPPVNWPPRRVLVSFGGTDVGQQTQEAVAALLEMPGIRIDAVLGTERALTATLASLAEHPEVTLHVALPSLVDLMSNVDLVIGAGGTATWERLCMGIPSIVTTVSQNQSGVTRAFHESNMTHWLGNAESVEKTDYERAIAEYMRSTAIDVLPIVDGFGATRVALSVLPLSSVSLDSRESTEADAPSVVTAGLSGNSGPQGWRLNRARFLNLVRDNAAPQLLCMDGTPVGVRYGENQGDEAWLEPFLTESINLKEMA